MCYTVVTDVMLQQRVSIFLSRYYRFLCVFVFTLFLSVGIVALPKIVDAATCGCGGLAASGDYPSCAACADSCRTHSPALSLASYGGASMTSCPVEALRGTSGSCACLQSDGSYSAATTISPTAAKTACMLCQETCSAFKFNGVVGNVCHADGSAGSSAAPTTPASDSAATPPSTLETGTDVCSEAGYLGYVCSGVTFILKVVVMLLGKVVLLILQVLLAFAKYNDFANAAPVTVGWPIVRDLCNMFFIIILLISAFSTIIDYGGGDMHYSKVLPKLLLMAVLINFSKTLIQLLIDFSQVVMLTFVNAFASAGQGNFVNALGLSQIMQISDSVPTGAVTGANIIVAYMLAVFMLGIMLSVVTIMTGFLIFRIVGLWIAVIMAPLALLFTAVPGKLSKYVSGVAGTYWSRLGSLLSGGPIMAFFLWLTLAIVQGANKPGVTGGGMSKVLNFPIEGNSLSFLTSIGDAQSIASFIVGIALLMMGLDQAVSISGQINPMLGRFAEKAKSAGMSVGRLGALAPFLAAGYAGKKGYAAADRRLDLTKRVSTAGLKATNALAESRVGSLLGAGALRSAVRPTLAKGMTMRREEAAKEAGAEKALLKKLETHGTDAELKMVGGAQSFGGSAFRTLGARAASMSAAEVLSSDKLRDREAKRNELAYVKQLSKPGVSEADAKSGSKVLAAQDAQREQTKFVQDRLRLAKSAKDLDTEEELMKAIKANPKLASDEERSKMIENLATDPDKYKDINKEDAMNGELLTGFMLKHGYTKGPNDELVLSDPAAYDRLKSSVAASKNSSLMEGLDAHESFVMNSPGLKVSDASKLQHRKNAADGMMQSFDVGRDVQGAWQSSAGTRVHTKNYGDARDALESDTKLRSSGAPSTVGSDVLASNFINNGGSLADYLKMAQTSPTDTVPLDTLKNLVADGYTKGLAALKSGNTKQANDELKVASKISMMLDQQGVTAATQSPITASISYAMRDPATGAVNADIIRKFDNLLPSVRDGLYKAIEVNVKRSDDAIQSGQPLTLEQQAGVALKDAISSEININKKNIPSRIINAHRPRPTT